MLSLMECKEQRVKTLLARIEKLNEVQAVIVRAGGEWNKGATMDRWMRAQKMGNKCRRELGALASIYLQVSSPAQQTHREE